MKKYLFMVAGLWAINSSYAQCTISGSNILKLNETTSFTVDTKGQCEECYLWKSSNDKNVTFEGSLKTNKINLTPKDVGKNNISVSILTDKGPVECGKTVEVVENKPGVAQNNCGINIDDFKEVKVSESVISFFPNENRISDYLYKWTVTYANGEIQESTEKIPQFFFSEINYITLVKLKITSKSPICSLSVSKKYEQNFWKPSSTTKTTSIEQKAYSQGSYNEYIKPDDNKIKTEINH
ncbi:hypothetical protein [Epilithonimonas hungarica]|uniref:Uncharacterized protein n=1 Tax=Epilithonimonas hungarica TaxID=454006 RepID=A0A1G7V839_9FLAO|nr:hypothetical protein [Epilithonimonas hungarica]MPT31665.1 hypothetical protein [Chryseobacterium sp.]SDG55887.1 hypothetical protein SAMN05421825_3552 [Epilithonimonas hungarica]